MQHYALLLALAKGIWSFDAATAAELTPLADRVLAGESIELLAGHGLNLATAIDKDVAEQVHVATASASGQVFNMGWYTDLDKVTPGSIAIVSMQGVILKHAMCGVGSMERASRILRAGQHPNVAAVMLDIDSPGGQVAGLSTVHDAILAVRAMGKPVLGFIDDGDCFSAAYHGASACTEIWASHPTCGVGSIGTMCQFTDTSEADKKEGKKRIAVYATDSTEKNQTYIKALAGDYTALIAELDVLNKDFQQKILAQRAAKIKDTSKVFKGQTYSATEALKLGLIDRIGNMQLALGRCAELAKLTGTPTPPAPDDELTDDDEDGDGDGDLQQANPSNSPVSMKQYPFMAALFGIAAQDFQNNAEGAHLNQAYLEKVEAALQSTGGLQSQVATLTTERNTAQGTLATVQGQLTTAQGEVTRLGQQLLKTPAGTEAAKTGQEQAPDGSDKNQVEPNAWEKLDQEMLAEVANW